jgi:hypothetical protein
MNNCQFKEINKNEEVIVSKDFEIKNGVLGLERDIYLNIVKFLPSSIVRKVSVNIFILFNFFVIVHWN